MRSHGCRRSGIGAALIWKPDEAGEAVPGPSLSLRCSTFAAGAATLARHRPAAYHRPSHIPYFRTFERFSLCVPLASHLCRRRPLVAVAFPAAAFEMPVVTPLTDGLTKARIGRGRRHHGRRQVQVHDRRLEIGEFGKDGDGKITIIDGANKDDVGRRLGRSERRRLRRRSTVRDRQDPRLADPVPRARKCSPRPRRSRRSRCS